MNWDAIGAMGEIIGAIAVLATLYYLSGQIKINFIGRLSVLMIIKVHSLF